jgi:hypothetical protein
MTMGIGFVCRDGVVIASDRQLTAPQYTDSDCKLHSHKWVNGRAIWSYAGNVDTANRLGAILWKDEHFGQFAAISSWSDVRDRLEASLRECLGENEEFYTLFGAWVEGATLPFLLLTTAAQAMAVPKCEIIGTGDSPLTRYLRGVFLGFPSYPTIQQATIAAIYFISKVKTYDAQFVGGGTDVWFVDADRQTKVMDVGKTKPWEEEIQDIEFRTNVLFRLLSDRELSPEREAKEIESFVSFLKPFCEKVRSLG